MTGIVAHTYPEWWLKLAGQVAHWSTDYSGSFLVLAVYTYDNLGVDDPAFALYINGEYVQYYALSEHYYS